MISKYEATGIFISIAVMAALLAFWRFGWSDFSVNPPSLGNQAAVIVATEEGMSKEAALADAITNAATTDGELQKLIIDDVLIGTEGPAVEEGDQVTVHYEGMTQNGIRFDSSYERGEPFTFTVGANRVIEGWEEGILGMRVGGERILVIPPHLAYGNAQVGPVPPRSVLVFKIELLEIN